MFRSRNGVVAVIGATALLLGACGDSEGDGEEDGDGEAAATSTEIEAEATEFQFSPDAWAVPAGEEFTIEFTNAGSTDHEWAVLKAGEDIASEDEFAEDKVLFEVEATQAGESVTESFTVEEAGTHQVICALPGHFDGGMEGTLTVG